MFSWVIQFFQWEILFFNFLDYYKIIHRVELCIYQLHVIYVFKKIGGMYFICLKLCNQMPETGGL